ncbi:hypothetical protein GPZ77_33755 [Streptomyces sp. QHH-9511]|uniref:hypothetical protein n=1 Tax=Streptomyces sp. QHH-9511 TaxID=2684468 RepID=UPI0013163075|nr:hypothetical protein [Streptomyces sp. QHH-9511]QGZ52605.1 hypothetical protein GPZ77_33755 [Streptomyces sp. QHH-9511]
MPDHAERALGRDSYRPGTLTHFAPLGEDGEGAPELEVGGAREGDESPSRALRPGKEAFGEVEVLLVGQDVDPVDGALGGVPADGDVACACVAGDVVAEAEQQAGLPGRVTA